MVAGTGMPQTYTISPKLARAAIAEWRARGHTSIVPVGPAYGPNSEGRLMTYLRLAYLEDGAPTVDGIGIWSWPQMSLVRVADARAGRELVVTINATLAGRYGELLIGRPLASVGALPLGERRSCPGVGCVSPGGQSAGATTSRPASNQAAQTTSHARYSPMTIRTSTGRPGEAKKR